MHYYAVIDTNVLVSALLSKNENASTVRILDELFRGTIIPVYSDEIMREYTEVLRRHKFGFSDIMIDTMIRAINDNGIIAEPMETGEELPDPKDIVFYEVVMAKREEGAMLVTGNMKHFPSKPFIVTPGEMLEIINT